MENKINRSEIAKEVKLIITQLFGVGRRLATITGRVGTFVHFSGAESIGMFKVPTKQGSIKTGWYYGK